MYSHKKQLIQYTVVSIKLDKLFFGGTYVKSSSKKEIKKKLL